VARRVASPVVRQAVVEDSYHMIPLDNDRNLAALRTVQFFNGLAQRAAAHPPTGPLDGPTNPGAT
jgi:hypothetical protein